MLDLLHKFLTDFRFYAEEGEIPSGSTASALDELMEMDEEETPDEEKEELEEKEEEPKEGEEKEEKEEKEEEIEIEEPEEELEVEDDINLVVPVKTRELIKAYPDIAKKFPQVLQALKRDREYSEIVPTPEDAKAAVEKASYFDRYQGDVFNGNPESILKAVKETDPKAFARLVDNYHTALGRVDPAALDHITGNTVKRLIMEMGNAGQKLNNEPLKAAAVLVHQFIFGAQDFSGPGAYNQQGQQQQGNEQNNPQQEAFVQQQFIRVHDDTISRARNAIKSTLDKAIDPKNSMTPFVKKNAVNQALQMVESTIANDPRFQSKIQRDWENAYRNNFSPESVQRIKTALLGYAKTLLPSAIRKTRQEALNGLGRKKEDKDRRGPIAAGRSSSDSGRKVTKAADIPKGMKTLDFLNQD